MLFRSEKIFEEIIVKNFPNMGKEIASKEISQQKLCKSGDSRIIYSKG